MAFRRYNLRTFLIYSFIKIVLSVLYVLCSVIGDYKMLKRCFFHEVKRVKILNGFSVFKDDRFPILLNKIGYNCLIIYIRYPTLLKKLNLHILLKSIEEIQWQNCRVKTYNVSYQWQLGWRTCKLSTRLISLRKNP